jgi:hypothetical protein
LEPSAAAASGAQPRMMRDERVANLDFMVRLSAFGGNDGTTLNG